MVGGWWYSALSGAGVVRLPDHGGAGAGGDYKDAAAAGEQPRGSLRHRPAEVDSMIQEEVASASPRCWRDTTRTHTVRTLPAYSPGLAR